MKFCWATLMVKDLEESLKFYTKVVGLKENRRFEHGPGSGIVFLGEGDTEVELIYNSQKQDFNLGSDISLGFEVESVDEMIAYLKDKGIELQSGPFSPNPRIKFFYVLDPNGLKIQFVENVKA